MQTLHNFKNDTFLLEPQYGKKYDKLRKNLIEQLVDLFQFERCKYDHLVYKKGNLLHQFLSFIGDWAKQGFPLNVFKKAKDGSISTTKISDKRTSKVFKAFYDLLDFIGHQEEDRIFGYLIFKEEISPLKIGAPRTLDLLTLYLQRLLDFWYLGAHGDYAFAIGSWLVNISPREFRHSNQIDKEVWEWIHGDFIINRINRRKRYVKGWLAQKPRAKKISWPDLDIPKIEHSSYANSFVIERLDLLKRMLHDQQDFEIDGKEVKVKLNAGSYERGGRKPPSKTHGTTFGIDIDLRGKEFNVKKAKNKDSIIKRINENPQKFLNDAQENGETHYSKNTFIPAVIFTEAILLTFPSRFVFGDPIVLSTAVGDVTDYFKNHDIIPPHSLSKIHFEPVAHHNHWHVDWFSEEMFSYNFTPIPKSVYKKKSWMKKSCCGKKESYPIRVIETEEKIIWKWERPFIKNTTEKQKTIETCEVEKFVVDELKLGTDDFKLPLGGSVEADQNAVHWFYQNLWYNRNERDSEDFETFID